MLEIVYLIMEMYCSALYVYVGVAIQVPDHVLKCISWWCYIRVEQAWQVLRNWIPFWPLIKYLLTHYCHTDVDLFLCPQGNFSRKTSRSFFGLLKSSKDECSGGQFFLGTTPLKPVSLPAGRFVLIIPPQFAGEHESPVKILIQPDKKSFLMLKL